MIKTFFWTFVSMMMIQNKILKWMYELDYNENDKKTREKVNANELRDFFRLWISIWSVDDKIRIEWSRDLMNCEGM